MVLLDARTVHELPTILPRRPRWWQILARVEDHEISASLGVLGFGPLTDGMREAYWRELREGQGMDDAGGFIWRCWEAALGLAHRSDVTSHAKLDPTRIGC